MLQAFCGSLFEWAISDFHTPSRARFNIWLFYYVFVNLEFSKARRIIEALCLKKGLPRREAEKNPLYIYWENFSTKQQKLVEKELAKYKIWSLGKHKILSYSESFTEKKTLLQFYSISLLEAVRSALWSWEFSMCVGSYTIISILREISIS